MVDIAWVYLDWSGELGNGDAARILIDTIERMIRHGHRNRMCTANKAIAKYLEIQKQRRGDPGTRIGRRRPWELFISSEHFCSSSR
jgi:hypothetical protein